MSETIRRGGAGSVRATPEASTGTSDDAAAAQALHVGEQLAGTLGELLVPFHDLRHRLLAVESVLQVGHRHSEELQQPARLVTGHGSTAPYSSTLISGASFHRGALSGLKFFVFTKCIPWCRFILNFPPPKRPSIHARGSSRNGAMSAEGRRASHLKRMVPANGSCTPMVAVNSGHTRPNSIRISRRDGRSRPRLRRLRLRYGSIRSQHHAAITTGRSVPRLTYRGRTPGL